LSHVEVNYVADMNDLHLKGHVMEIPIPELDDPPDDVELEAASLQRELVRLSTKAMADYYL